MIISIKSPRSTYKPLLNPTIFYFLNDYALHLLHHVEDQSSSMTPVLLAIAFWEYLVLCRFFRLNMRLLETFYTHGEVLLELFFQYSVLNSRFFGLDLGTWNNERECGKRELSFLGDFVVAYVQVNISHKLVLTPQSVSIASTLPCTKLSDT